MSGGRGGSLMRLRGLVRKEFLQIVRDPSSIAIAFLMPLFLLLLLILWLLLLWLLVLWLLIIRLLLLSGIFIHVLIRIFFRIFLTEYMNLIRHLRIWQKLHRGKPFMRL